MAALGLKKIPDTPIWAFKNKEGDLVETVAPGYHRILTGGYGTSWATLPFPRLVGYMPKKQRSYLDQRHGYGFLCLTPDQKLTPDSLIYPTYLLTSHNGQLCVAWSGRHMNALPPFLQRALLTPHSITTRYAPPELSNTTMRRLEQLTPEKIMAMSWNKVKPLGTVAETFDRGREFFGRIPTYARRGRYDD